MPAGLGEWQAVMRSPDRGSPDPPAARARGRVAPPWCVLAAIAVLLCCCVAAGPAAGQGLVVLPAPASGPALSYLKLSLARGQTVVAGTIGLRNPTGKPLRVALQPVVGKTLDTLGSAYGAPGGRARGPARWLRLGSRRVTLPPGATIAVPVSVSAPRTAKPGDYLAGVSIEDLGQQAGQVQRHGVSIASVVRYAIGVETSLRGPRHPLIQFTGAQLRREPAGVTFLLDARNPGNAILQNVRGRALITRGRRVVASVRLGPGTFVTNSSIAYPILTRREHPSQGTVYRVRAVLRYAGRVARMDTRVRFGRAAALRQKLYGGSGGGASFPTWLAALLGVLGGALLGGALAYYLRIRAGLRSPTRLLRAGLASARASGQPLSLLVVSAEGNGAAARKLAPVLRSRLRHSDRFCQLDRSTLLVLAPGTDADTAEALAADLRRHLDLDSVGAVNVEVTEPVREASTAELLQRLRGGSRAPAPTG
jgi:hypothetical protein